MENELNVLVSTICFVNRKKPGAEIYATFAQRLIEDVMNKTPYDIMITTNEPEHFLNQKSIYGDRIILRMEPLENHRLVVGVFNQLLKFYSIKDIDSKYDWVLYLDCDAGFTDKWDVDEVKNMLNENLSTGFDMLGTRTNCILHYELQDHETKLKEYNQLLETGVSNPYFAGNLFSNKFIFYSVSSENGPKEWFNAILPSEHVFMVKNDERLPVMSKTFEDFCFKFETQSEYPVTVDMEAFEIGVSALLSGYNIGDFGNYGLYHIIKVVCNHNNWEKVKY
jgi:hypothetical protein